jgi:hypothetical protein
MDAMKLNMEFSRPITVVLAGELQASKGRHCKFGEPI